MKTLRKVKKQWVAVLVGVASGAIISNGQMVSANSLSEASTGPLEETTLVDTSLTKLVEETNPDTGLTFDGMSGVTSFYSVSQPSVVQNQPNNIDTSVGNETIEKEISELSEIAVIELERQNDSEKIRNAVTDVDNRTVVTAPTSDLARQYQVKYDSVNKWYYIDAKDFGVDTSGANDATDAINEALRVADAIIMTDSSGKVYNGVAVKLSGLIKIDRPEGSYITETSVVNPYVQSPDREKLLSKKDIENFLSHPSSLEEARSALGNKPGTSTFYFEQQDKVKLAYLKKVLGDREYLRGLSEEEANRINSILSNGAVRLGRKRLTLSNAGKEFIVDFPIAYPLRTGRVYEKFNQPFKQIKIGQELQNVTALYGDGQGKTQIVTNLVQNGAWDSNYNNTDSRDHAVILVERQNGFIVKDLTVALKDTKNQYFYNPDDRYSGKVNGIQVDNSSHVTVESVEVYGANRAGVDFSNSSLSVPSDGTNLSLGFRLANERRFKDVERNTNNKLLDSNLHHNRVAGNMYGYQKNFLIDGNILSYNGHQLSGGTGYGTASSAGSYNTNVIITNNKTLYNNRKGIDIHDGDHILIRRNTSYGDRLFGISVYNRAFPMEYVVIKDNLVIQDPSNRVFEDDLLGATGTLYPVFRDTGDYVEYSAIFLQTNEKEQNLSNALSYENRRAYFDISNNTIRGLATTEAPEDVLDKAEADKRHYEYMSRAIFVRMNEKELDYVLNIRNNSVKGESANGLVQVINNTWHEKDFNKPGNGSGHILVKDNQFDVKNVRGANNGLSPVSVTEILAKAKTYVNANKERVTDRYYQDKFRGSVVFDNNSFKLETLDGKNSKRSGLLFNVDTNAEVIKLQGNEVTSKRIVGAVDEDISPLFKISGVYGPNGLLNNTQPVIFVGNTFDLGIISYADSKNTFDVIKTPHALPYFKNNIVSAQSYKNTYGGNRTAYHDHNKVKDSDQLRMPLTGFSSNERVEKTIVDLGFEREISLNPNLEFGKEMIRRQGTLGRKEISKTILTIDGQDNVKSPKDSTVIVTPLVKADNIAESTLKHGDYLEKTTNAPYVYQDKQIKQYDNFSKLPLALKPNANVSYESHKVLDKPVNEKVDVGTKLIVSDYLQSTEVVPYKRVETKSDALFEGDIVELSQGKNGTRTTTKVLFKNQQTGLVESEEVIDISETEKPTDHKVLLGTKPLRSIIDRVDQESIAFNTVEVETDEYFVGEVVEFIAGEKGVLEKHYKDTFNNKTQLVEESDLVSSSITKQARTRILKRGRKALTNTVERTVQKPIVLETVYEDSSDLYVGEERIKTEGIEGVFEQVFEDTIDAKTGQVTSSRLVKERVVTEPVAKVVQRGTKVRETTQVKDRVVNEVLPFEIKHQDSQELFVGEERVEKIGKPGSRHIVYRDTINLSDGKVLKTEVISETTIAPEHQLVLVGRKLLTNMVERRVFKQLALETVYEDSSDLYVGEERVKTTGVDGVLEQTFEDTIDAKTGQVMSSRLVKERIVTEPVAKVVQRGTKERPKTELIVIEEHSDSSAKPNATLPILEKQSDEDSNHSKLKNQESLVSGETNSTVLPKTGSKGGGLVSALGVLLIAINVFISRLRKKSK